MQARSVCASVVKHARQLNTRALIAMANAGICLYEYDGINNAVMILAKENNLKAVELLIRQFHFSIVEAVHVAAASGHTLLVDHLIALSSSAELDTVRFRAVRGYSEAGRLYNEQIKEIIGTRDVENTRYILEAITGREKSALPAERDAVDDDLQALAHINADLFYLSISQVMMAAATLGDIRRINQLNQLFWEGNALTLNDAHHDPKFCRAAQYTGVMTGLVLGRHYDLLHEYNQYFKTADPALLSNLMLKIGTGMGMLGDMDLLADTIGELNQHVNLVKDLKMGAIIGLNAGYHMPAMLNLLKPSSEALLSPKEYQDIIDEMLNFYGRTRNRASINFITGLLPDISKEKLDNYFKGCDLSEKLYICATQNDEATRIVFLQSMEHVTPEDTFDVGHEVVSYLLKMNQMNYYMQSYGLTNYQVRVLERLSDLLSAEMISIFVLKLNSAIIELVMKYLIDAYAADILKEKKLTITEADLDPLSVAVVDVAKAKLSRCASRLFPNMKPTNPTFEPDMVKTKQLWDAGLKRRARY